MLTLGRVLLSNIEHGIVQGAAHQKLKTEVVDALGVAVSLTLLGFVPVQDQTITEGQASGRIGGVLVAIEDASSERGFNMTDNLLLKVVLAPEATSLVFLPCLALGFGDGSYSRWLASRPNSPLTRGWWGNGCSWVRLLPRAVASN